MKIRAKLYLSFGVVLSLMIIMVAISLYLNKEIETANSRALDKMDEIIFARNGRWINLSGRITWQTL